MRKSIKGFNDSWPMEKGKKKNKTQPGSIEQETALIAENEDDTLFPCV